MLEIAGDDSAWLDKALLLTGAALEELDAREELREIELGPAVLTLEELA